MIPFYIFYSMFGFQRIGDLAWAAGDARARGFLMGGTAGRTTLNGEGLQHEDGHSHILASTIPNCVTYDPTYAYELAVIIQDGLRRMYKEQENVYYYITMMNENYVHPPMPKGAEEGIMKGMYLLKRGAPKKKTEGAAAGLRHHPARSDRGSRSAGSRFRRVRRHLERHQLQRAAPRRPRRAALEHAAPGAHPAHDLRREMPEGRLRPGDCFHRLHESLRRPDPRLRAAPLRDARHRRLRPQRQPRETCAASSRSTATMSWWLRSRRWPTRT